MCIPIWIAFVLFVLLMPAVDLGVLHRRARSITTSEALCWTGVWVIAAMMFAQAVYCLYESKAEAWTAFHSDLPGKQALL
jgi:tellurite resistance protein TerC